MAAGILRPRLDPGATKRVTFWHVGLDRMAGWLGTKTARPTFGRAGHRSGRVEVPDRGGSQGARPYHRPAPTPVARDRGRFTPARQGIGCTRRRRPGTEREPSRRT